MFKSGRPCVLQGVSLSSVYALGVKHEEDLGRERSRDRRVTHACRISGFDSESKAAMALHQLILEYQKENNVE